MKKQEQARRDPGQRREGPRGRGRLPQGPGREAQLRPRVDQHGVRKIVFFLSFFSKLDEKNPKMLKKKTSSKKKKKHKTQKQDRLGQPRRLPRLFALLRPRPGPQPARLERVGLPADEPGVRREGRPARGGGRRGRRGDRAGAAALMNMFFLFRFPPFFSPSPPRARARLYLSPDSFAFSVLKCIRQNQ